MSDHDDPRRILIVRLSHLGDVAQSLPLFHALASAYPQARIAWAVQPEFAGLLRGLPGLERVLLFERRGGLRAWRALRAELRDFGAELCVDAQGNLKSAAVALLSGAARRAGYAAAEWRERAGALSLNWPSAHSGERHAGARVLALARHVCGPRLPGDYAWRADAALSPTERALGAHLCDQYLPPGPSGLVLALAICGDVRSWPLEHAFEFARLCARSGQPLLLLSGPAEAAAGAQLAERLGPLPGVRHWVGQRGLRELCAFFEAAAARGARLVACDSGPAHLAAACALPVMLLEGPQAAQRTGPFDALGRPLHHSLRSAEALACAPCLRRRCSLPGHSASASAPCMQGIGTAQLFAALHTGGAPRA